jgi:hypothetical protein
MLTQLRIASRLRVGVSLFPSRSPVAGLCPHFRLASSSASSSSSASASASAAPAPDKGKRSPAVAAAATDDAPTEAAIPVVKKESKIKAKNREASDAVMAAASQGIDGGKIDPATKGLASTIIRRKPTTPSNRFTALADRSMLWPGTS